MSKFMSASHVHDVMPRDSPYAATKTDVSSAITLLFVMPNSPAICSPAGAIMEDETGLMKVNAETIRVAAHFFFLLQLQKRTRTWAFAPTTDELLVLGSRIEVHHILLRILRVVRPFPVHHQDTLTVLNSITALLPRNYHDTSTQDVSQVPHNPQVL